MVLGNFQCRRVLLILIIVGQGSTVLAGGNDLDAFVFFSLAFHFCFLFPLFERWFDIN